MLALLAASACQRQPTIRVVIPRTAPLLDVAATEVAARLGQAGYAVEISSGPDASAAGTHAIVLNTDPSLAGLGPEAFEVRSLRASGLTLFRVTGSDLRGTLWGALEVAGKIASADTLESIRSFRAGPFLRIRGAQLPLPLPGASASREAQMQARELWRERFDLLLRSRFNSIFFYTREPLPRFTEPPGATPDDASDGDAAANAAWLHDLFEMAQDRGLDVYLSLPWSAAGKPVSFLAAPASPETGGEAGPEAGMDAGMEAPPTEDSPPLTEPILALADAYLELAGIVFDQAWSDLPAAPEQQGAWLAEQVLAPLARAIIPPLLILPDGAPFSLRDLAAAVEPPLPVGLLTPFQSGAATADAAGFPRLWRVDAHPAPLHPWQDPEAVRTALRSIGEAESLGFYAAFPSDSQPNSQPGLQQSQQQSPQQSPPHAPYEPGGAVDEQDWFQRMLWGRLGYSPQIPFADWEKEFAAHYGDRPGPLVLRAVTGASKILDWINVYGGRPRTGLLPSGAAFPPGGALSMEDRLFRTSAPPGYEDLFTAVLRQEGMLASPAESVSGNTPWAIAEALELEAASVLEAAERAGRYRVWNGGANADLYQRIRFTVALGRSEAEALRAAASLARFLLGPDEKPDETDAESDRQEAAERLRQARQRLEAVPQGAPQPSPFSARLASLSRDLEAVTALSPWRWQKTSWETGALEEWAPATVNTVPEPPAWRLATVSHLNEFGPYRNQPRMSAFNQKLRPAFLTVDALGQPADSSLLVARTTTPAPQAGLLVIRTVSDRSVTVWVNGRRAVAVSSEQFPWVAAAPPHSPFRTQLFSAPAGESGNEVVLAARAEGRWPEISPQLLLVPQQSGTIRLQAEEAVSLEGGIRFAAGTEAFPQPHIGLGEGLDGELGDDSAGDAPPLEDSAAKPRAVYRFRVEHPGFYRMRLWCYWRTADAAGLTLALDGTLAEPALGSGSAVLRRWLWTPAEFAADLGAGEHTLEISGWKPGALLGIIEVFPALSPPS